MYGKSANIDLNESQSERGMLIEYAEFMTSTSDSQLNNNNHSINNNHMDAMPNVEMNFESVPTTTNAAPQAQTATTQMKAIHKQIETRTAEGKRRITPMFIPLQDDVT